VNSVSSHAGLWKGTVWEETLIHLPPAVQMVALSATLHQPEHFLAWIGRARGRPGDIV
jgi:ATP-dependent RNA helicase HelY